VFVVNLVDEAEESPLFVLVIVFGCVALVFGVGMTVWSVLRNVRRRRAETQRAQTERQPLVDSTKRSFYTLPTDTQSGNVPENDDDADEGS
jgi:Na+/melibiose symporter-like transporter